MRSQTSVVVEGAAMRHKRSEGERMPSWHSAAGPAAQSLQGERAGIHRPGPAFSLASLPKPSALANSPSGPTLSTRSARSRSRASGQQERQASRGQKPAKMSDTNGRGVPLTGGAVYDKELYGGGDVTGYAAVAADLEEEELDEREAAVARCAGRHWGPPALHGCLLCPHTFSNGSARAR